MVFVCWDSEEMDLFLERMGELRNSDDDKVFQ
jgi:hypothetical protein